MLDTAGILADWARAETNQVGDIKMHIGEARLPWDASQKVADKALEWAIVQWVRWNRGRGWQLVSGVHVGQPRPTLDLEIGRTLPDRQSRELSAAFEYRGSMAA